MRPRPLEVPPLRTPSKSKHAVRGEQLAERATSIAEACGGSFFDEESRATTGCRRHASACRGAVGGLSCRAPP